MINVLETFWIGVFLFINFCVFYPQGWWFNGTNFMGLLDLKKLWVLCGSFLK
jgi:hypothetical protein